MLKGITEHLIHVFDLFLSQSCFHVCVLNLTLVNLVESRHLDTSGSFLHLRIRRTQNYTLVSVCYFVFLHISFSYTKTVTQVRLRS